MLPEQQQRILGYFIEEARDHLNTIEQGLLNLQSTLNDPEMINEVFRAAHSIKGGAAMLGLTSIQHTSHRLEDCFKVLKENPIRVDQKLESLFLGVSDTLKALLEQLSGPFGLSEEAANTLMSETEPVFQWLHEHLELLVQKGVGGGVSEHLATQPYPADSVGTLTEIFFRQDGGNTGGEIYRTTSVKPIYAPVSAADQWGEFQAQVLQTLREMLQLFKQPATPATRQHLQDCCNDLVKIGKTWNLPNWCNLCKASANAIANQENTYLTLAKIVITEIKQGQELVLQGREPEITISHRLEALWGFPEMPLLEVAQNLLGDVPIIVNKSFREPVTLETEAPIALPTDSVTSLTEISEQLEPQNVTSQNYTTANILFDSEDHTLHSTSKIHTHGPEVGLAELNTLADLFEGETPELDETWQQEEILNITDAGDLRREIRETENEEIDSDIADFLSLDDEKETATQISSIHEEIDSDIAEFLSLDDEKEATQISSIHEEIDSDIAEFLSLDDEKEELQNDTSNSENLSLIFGDNFLGQDNQESQNLFKAPITAGEILQENREKANKLPDADDVIDDLLELSFDEDSSTLPSVAIDSDNLFLEKDINVDSLEEVKLSHDSEPKLITPTKDSSLSNLFNDLEASPLLSKDESELNDLFDLPSATISESAQTEDDLDNFWDSATEDESEQLIEAVLQEDIAQALEESLFAAVASSDIYAESQQSISTSFDLEDLDITFLQEEEELDLIFSSDTENDLFGELSANDSSISADIQLREGDRQISPPEIQNFSQQPEALDFVPEFTTQLQEFSSVTDLEVDLFNEINGDAKALESTENVENNDLFVTANTLDLQQPEAVIEHSLSTVDLTSEIELGDDLPITNSALSELTDDLTDITFEDTSDFARVETFIEFSAPTVEENSEFRLNDDSLITDADESDLTSELTDITFDSTDDFAILETPATEQSIELDLGADLLITDADESDLTSELTDITFDSTDDLGILETPSSEQSSELDLGADLLITDADESDLTSELTDITFDSTDDFAILETPATEQSIELDLGADLLITDADESELTSELTDITFESTDDFAILETPSSEQSSELDLGADLLITDADESELIGELTDITFESTDDFAILETPSSEQSSELDLGADLLITDADESELTLDESITETHGLTDVAVEDISTSEFDELELMITGDRPEATDSEAADAFADLSALLGEAVTQDEEENAPPVSEDTHIQDEFADLEALLAVESTPSNDNDAIATDDFAALEALLGGNDTEVRQQPQPVVAKVTPTTPITPPASPDLGDEFSDLEKLLAEADQTISHSSPIKPTVGKTARGSNRRTARFEETMKVPVKQLDEMSNLVGELVVNRNTLEQDQERLRQSLDNLLIQVQQLSDVGARMQELYERSLLEASLLASRKTREVTYHEPDTNSDRNLSPLELDRFTPFHTLSQEMIELIVRVRESASDIDFVTEETERVARQFRQVTTQLQEGLTRARMVPFSQTIDRLRRGVRDNAIKFGKQVELVIEGGDTLIDKMILDHLNDPLTHMLNNAIAHGIETPEIRQAANKPPVGTITIRAFHQGNQTVISVGDDGAGIDTERIKAKAVKVGMMTPAQAKAMSRMEVYDLLFQAGFSTKDQADEIAGRGVGMDVVRSEISEIRGAVNTDSTVGKGTTFTIRLPLTLSICKALCCVSDKARIAFPMDGVEDTLDIPAKNVHQSPDGQSFISWRDTVLPFRPLKDLLTFNRQLSRGNVYGGTRDDDMISVVVARSGSTLIALQIDQVLSEQEIVIKQFEGPAPKPIGVAGATVLGDGRIMPIADVLEIIDIFQGRMSKHSGGTLWQQATPPTAVETPAEKIDPTVLIVDDSITVRELLSLTFNKAGYRVEQARDGQEAWDKIRSGLPCDIVFCDIEMPRCDGLELLSRIQKDSNLNHLPIAMLTSRGADKHRQMAIQLGASGYFTKPYLEEALLEAAVRMLKGEKLVGHA